MTSRFVSIACSLVLASCSRTPPASAPARDADADGPSAHAAVPVATAVVRDGALPQYVVGYGTVGGGPNAKADLAFSQAGRIAAVDVSVGERVTAGTVLARLDARPFQAELDQARASLAVAQAARSKARLGASPQQIAETSAQARQARTQFDIARTQVEREAALFRLGIAARADVDAARAALATAKGQLDVLRLQASAEAHPWKPDVDAADAGVAEAESVASGARQKVAMTELVAPFAGTVVARFRNDGESVDATTPVVELAGDANPTFTAQFPPEDALRLHLGDAATVEAAGASTRGAGTLVAIDPAQGSTHTVAALIRLRIPPQALDAFGPGAYGTASIRVGTRRGLIVPEPAIVTDAATGAIQLFRKHDERFEPVPVTVEARADGRAIVRAPGLRAGDRVATQGAYELLTPQQAPKADGD